MSERADDDSARAGQAGQTRPRSLPLAQWPEADRFAWQSACAPGARLRRGGAAAHLKQITRDDLERRYGYFLDYLARAGLLDPKAGAAGQVTPERVDDFIAELRARVGSVTLAQTICKLRRMTSILAPKGDLEWLVDIERDLASEAVPKSRGGQFVHGPRLLEAGLTMVKEGAIAESLSPFKRARLVRDGLMIAVLAIIPIRLKNCAALECGRSIRRVRDGWWITLDRRETKSGRPDERPIHEVLQDPLQLYLRCARPILSRETQDWRTAGDQVDFTNIKGALWIDSNLGQAMSYSGVEKAIAEATRSALGVTLRPHMFRSCTATTAYVIAGDNPHLASALLQHTDAGVTQKNYNRATNTQAAITYSELVDAALES